MKKRRSFHILLFSCFLSLLTTSASSALLEPFYLGYGVDRYTAIYQDERGLIWLGSERGLFIYNGYQPTLLKMSSNIYSIIPIEKDRICYTDDSNIYILETQTEHLLNATITSAETGRTRSAFYQDGILYAGTDKQGLIAYDCQTNKWSVLYRNIGECYTLIPVSNKIYIGGTKGLDYYDLGSNQLTHLALPVKQIVNSMLWDATRKCIWVGCIGALYQYFPTNGEFIQINVPENSFKCMILDINNHLLLGTDNGLIIYNPETKEMERIEHDVRYQQSLSSNIIWGLYQDRLHNIWLATDQGVTLMRYTPLYQEIPILELAKDIVPPTGQGNHISHIYQDAYGDYWFVGTNGAIQKQKNGKTYWYRKEDKQYTLPHSRVRQIKEDRDKRLWMATDGGLLYFDRQKHQFFKVNIIDKKHNMSIEWIYDIWDNGKGKLWIIAYNGGIFVLDKKELLHCKEVPYEAIPITEYIKSSYDIPLLDASILVEDKQGNIWVPTEKKLVLIDTKNEKLTSIPLLDEETNNITRQIANLIVGDDGNLWYGIDNNIGKINPITKENQILPLDLFDENDHIQMITYHAGYLWIKSIYKTIVLNDKTLNYVELHLPDSDYRTVFYDKENDRLIFGGNDALLYIDPEIIKGNPSPYPVQVVSVYSNNKRLELNIDYNRKKYNNNEYDIFTHSLLQLTIEISDYSFSESKTMNYEYQLENSDSKWISVGPGNNRITLLNLSPGKYKLNMRNSTNKDLVSSYYFKITPPWYLSNWAYSIYAFLILLVTSGLIRYIFIRNERKFERMEREKSLEVSNLKLEFFSNISHELKTPLSLIIAPLTKLISDNKGTETEESLNLVYANAQRLNKLIQRILDFKRVEYQDNDSMLRSRVGLNRLVSVITDSFMETIKERNLTLHIQLSPEEIWMNLDLLKIESVLYNLLSNAVKFVPDNTGSITISTEKKEDKVFITVSDNGIGIPEKEQNLIWLRLYQGKNKKENPKGTGIGLYLVKKYVSMHNGEITIESSPGNGSTFKVFLPFTQENILPNTNHINDKQEISNKLSLLPTILIVDDNEELLSFLTKTISDKYQCLKANNGRRGLEIAQKEHPDLIIADEMMPEMSGLKMCQHIRNDKRTASTPIIMLTAKDDKETEMNSIKTGIDVFMPKPFDLDQLMLRIEQLLLIRKELQEQMKLNVLVDKVADVKEEVFNGDERLMKDIFRIIEERLSDPSFNVSILSEELGVSQKQLLRTLKKQVGETSVNFIRKIRLKKAALLIQQHKFTISEIMYMVGFSHPSYFSKCFVEEFGVTPKEYEEQPYTENKEE